jgi:hypothetical protein
VTALPVPVQRVPRRFLVYVAAAAAALGAIIGVDTFLLHLRVDPLADVRAYYDAGARLNAGLALYEQPAGVDEAAFYRYPPLLAILFRPLALLPFEVAGLVWFGVLCTMLGATVVRLGVRRRATWLLIGILAAPIGWSLAVGQAEVAVSFLVALGAPWAVAAAAHLKLLPALAAIYWVGRRDWRSMRAFGLWLVGFGLLSLVLEPAGTIAYLGFPSLAQVGDVINRSPFAISPYLWLVSVALLGIVALRLAPTRWGWAAAVALSVLATPRLFPYHLMTLLAAGRAPDAGRGA